LWLIAPLVLPVLVAVVLWGRGRPRRPATTTESIGGYQNYLQALGQASQARSASPAMPVSPAARTGRRGDNEPD
jgi:hypothetical protein